jgi:4-hydroxybenzoate polyprenyltransferase
MLAPIWLGGGGLILTGHDDKVPASWAASASIWAAWAWLVLLEWEAMKEKRWDEFAGAVRPRLSSAAKLQREEPLGPKTTMRVGGAARVYAEPASIEDLRVLWREAQARGVEVFWLGRGSNLPTLWSNCLAGWWLGGGGNFWKLPFLFLGASLLYTGGMFLNDAFDEEFDRQRRPERPIPAGKILTTQVWKLGFAQLGLGILLLAVCGKIAAACAVLLAVTILLYDFTHKFFTESPWLMGACRYWIYVIAGATGMTGLNGFAVFSGLALAFYITGLSYVARRETSRGKILLPPLALLATPIILAFLLNAGDFRRDALWISLVLLLWLARCLRNIFLGGERNTPWVVTNLLAGIVFVDWLAVAPMLPHWQSAVTFLVLFGLTKWFQRFVPAT